MVVVGDFWVVVVWLLGWLLWVIVVGGCYRWWSLRGSCWVVVVG